MTVNIYNDPIDVRIARVKEQLYNRDYEGNTTLLTSDVYEIVTYVENARKLVGFLNRTEESDSGRVFKPLSMTCCRTLWMDDISKILNNLGVG